MIEYLVLLSLILQIIGYSLSIWFYSLSIRGFKPNKKANYTRKRKRKHKKSRK